MKAEAFRDDLAARAFSGTLVGTNLAAHLHVGVDPGARDTTTLGCFANSSGSGMVGYVCRGTDREWRFTHTDGTQFTKTDPAKGESYGVWAMKCAEEAERNRALIAESFGFGRGSLGRFRCDGSYQFDDAPASAQERAARKAGKVTLTIPAMAFRAQVEEVKPEPLTFPRLLADTDNIMLASRGAPNATRLWQLLKGLSDENVHDLLVFGSDAVNMDAVSALFRVFTDGVQPNDTPAIAAAMAAKNVQPTPEPVLSIAGEEGTAAEFAQALQLVRAKNAPPVKETPRGLMTVAAMDHRLGRWNEA